MASNRATVERIAAALAPAGTVTYRPMFGEYGLYLDGKFIGTVENDMLCIKITEAGKARMPELTIVSPHDGAYYFHVADLDKAAELARVTCDALPAKRMRK